MDTKNRQIHSLGSSHRLHFIYRVFIFSEFWTELQIFYIKLVIHQIWTDKQSLLLLDHPLPCISIISEKQMILLQNINYKIFFFFWSWHSTNKSQFLCHWQTAFPTSLKLSNNQLQNIEIQNRDTLVNLTTCLQY